MSRRIIGNYKFAVLVGILISTLIYFIVFRRLLTSPGLIEYRDISPGYDSSHNYILKYSHTWDPYKSSDNFPYLNALPMYFLSTLIRNSVVEQRSLYFIVFALMGTIIFSTTFAWLRERYKDLMTCYIASTVALFIYTLNPWVTNQITHPHYLWAYAFTPLIFYFTPRAINQTSRTKLVKYSLILGLILFLTTTSYVGISINVLFFVYLIIFEILIKIRRNDVKSSIRLTVNGVILFVLAVVLALLLFSFYLLPYIVEYRVLISPEAVTLYKTYTPTYLDFLRGSAERTLLQAIRGLTLWWGEPLYSLSSGLTVLLIISTIIIPVFAFLALILRPKNETVISLAILALMLMFLAKASNPPFGSFYTWLYFLFERQLGGLDFLKFLQFGMPLLYLTYALLCGITMTKISTRLCPQGSFKSRSFNKRFIVTILIATLVICSTAFNSFPLLTGDLRGSLTPVVLPSFYGEMNDFLESQEGDFRVYWLPNSEDVIWNPSKNAVDPWSQRGVKQLPLWASSRPSTAGGGILHLGKEPEWKMFEHFIYEILQIGEISSAGKLFGSENVNYIIYHNDTFDYTEHQHILENLFKQNDLKLAYSNEYLYVFANEHSSSYVYSSDKAMLVVGSLDVLSPLCNFDSYIPYNYPIIFLEQNLLTKTELTNYLSFADSILFYEDKDFDDLVLSSVNREYVYTLADYLPKPYKPSTWIVDYFYSNKWVNRLVSPTYYNGSRYDFDLSKKIVIAESKNASLSFPIKVSSNNLYEVWARFLRSPYGGNVTFMIDDAKYSELLTKPNQDFLKGFKWIKLCNASLNEGEHKITIINDYGWNAINLLAVIPTDKMEQHRRDLLESLLSSVIQFINLKTPLMMDDYPGPVNISKASEFYVPKDQKYAVALQTNLASDPSNVTVRIDDANYTLKLEKNGVKWNYVSPIDLSEGWHRIILQCETKGVELQTLFIYSIDEEYDELHTLDEVFQKDSLPFVTKYEKRNPTMITVEVNATNPFILSFAESLDPLWVAHIDDGTNLPKVNLNSVLNGFLVNKTGSYTITIEFIPERYYQIGIIITLATLFLVCSSVTYLTLEDKIRRRLNGFKSRII